MKKSYDIEKGIATFTFEGLEPLTLDTSKLSAENEQRMLGHGIEARLGDMAAIPRKDGIVVTEQMRRDAVAAGIAHYESGTKDWNMKGVRVAPQNPTILKIAEKRGCTYAEAEAYIAEQMLKEIEG